MSATEIKAIRNTLRLTAKQLADILGVTENTIYRWEMGVRNAKGAAVSILRQMDKDGKVPDWYHPTTAASA